MGGAVDDPALTTTLAGIPLRNPVGLAAGFDKSCARLDALGSLGFGYVVGGTVTRAPRSGNPHPRIVRDPARRAIVNAMGMPNPGAEAVARNLTRTPRTAPRFVSIADEPVADTVATAELLEPFVDGIELNASSPNAGWEHASSHTGELVRAVRARTSKPLFVKIPPPSAGERATSTVSMATAARDAGASAIVCTNTVPVVDARMSTGRGGLSGGRSRPRRRGSSPRSSMRPAAACRWLRAAGSSRRMSPPVPGRGGDRRPGLHGPDLRGARPSGGPHARPRRGGPDDGLARSDRRIRAVEEPGSPGTCVASAWPWRARCAASRPWRQICPTSSQFHQPPPSGWRAW